MLDLLSYQNFHLVGIKGVAMTALAQLLVDAKKNVTGTDVSSDFVTKDILNKLNIKVDTDFGGSLPQGTEVLIYTAAHGGPNNPMVLKTKNTQAKVLSHAEALASFFNQKLGIAVCGVGGKSTTSAMLSYIFQQVRPESFAVGVGDISGLHKTGQWLEDSQYMVAEADEYVVDPSAPSRGEEITPRFSFLKPKITVCTNLGFDHPDVYRDFDHTKSVYLQFFRQIKNEGILVVNADDQELVGLAQLVSSKILTFGEGERADLRLLSFRVGEEATISEIKLGEKIYGLTLRVPGKYNVLNALAAILAAKEAGISMEDSIQALSGFASTKRRFEFIGEKSGVKYYDDYAHHPDEIKAVIQALNEWAPHSKKVIAFQSHTFSRTKQLLGEFARAFDQAETLVMIDIFPSAREKFDPSITSELLCQKINEFSPHVLAKNLGSVENLAAYFESLPSGTIVLTIGAGDIYEVHNLVK